MGATAAWTDLVIADVTTIPNELFGNLFNKLSNTITKQTSPEQHIRQPEGNVKLTNCQGTDGIGGSGFWELSEHRRHRDSGFGELPGHTRHHRQWLFLGNCPSTHGMRTAASMNCQDTHG